MVLVIMAAGMGSRYGGLKQIDPVGAGGEFILDYSIYDAIKAGFNKVVFVIKEENLELFRSTVGQRIEKVIDVEYAFQDLKDVPSFVKIPAERTKPWGTAHAVLASRKYVDDNFAVINADDFYGREAFMLLGEYLKTAKSDAKKHYAMVGYVLKNTLTENGHVARGVCRTDKDGYLTEIVERTKIQRNDGQTQFFEDTTGWTDLDENTTVSMNCWGFTPDFFDTIEGQMTDFFRDPANDLNKGEFFLPFVVEKSMNKGECDVRVLNSTAKWHGVTYKEDREKLIESIGAMVDSGIYPKYLWK